jgi:hypothetical protein
MGAVKKATQLTTLIRVLRDLLGQIKKNYPQETTSEVEKTTF